MTDDRLTAGDLVRQLDTLWQLRWAEQGRILCGQGAQVPEPSALIVVIDALRLCGVLKPEPEQPTTEESSHDNSTRKT